MPSGGTCPRDVGACEPARYVLLAQENTGQRLDLDVYERVALSTREPAHLFLNEDDVVDDLLVEARHDLGDACVVEAECFRAPPVELLEYFRTAVSP